MAAKPQFPKASEALAYQSYFFSDGTSYFMDRRRYNFHIAPKDKFSPLLVAVFRVKTLKNNQNEQIFISH